MKIQCTQLWHLDKEMLKMKNNCVCAICTCFLVCVCLCVHVCGMPVLYVLFRMLYILISVGVICLLYILVNVYVICVLVNMYACVWYVHL